MCVLEARDLPAVKDSYYFVKLKLGKSKSKTCMVLTNTNNPVWNEEFVFKVRDQDVLVVSVLNSHHFLLGEVRIPVKKQLTLQPTWFSLQTSFSTSIVVCSLFYVACIIAFMNFDRLYDICCFKLQILLVL